MPALLTIVFLINMFKNLLINVFNTPLINGTIEASVGKPIKMFEDDQQYL